MINPKAFCENMTIPIRVLSYWDLSFLEFGENGGGDEKGEVLLLFVGIFEEL